MRFKGNPKSIKPTNAGINAIEKGIPNIIEYLIFIWQCNLPFNPQSEQFSLLSQMQMS
jgi:hypothetical protein